MANEQGGREQVRRGTIPVVKIEGNTLPEVWEQSLLALWDQGCEIPTEYDQAGEPESRDCTMLMVVHQPMLEPRLHLLLPAAGWSTLEEYRLEVVEGLHPRDEEVGQSYTYHQRLFSYPGIKGPFDQIEFIVTKLAEATYSRRAQAITWDPDRDTKTPYPPCLQRVWCRAPRDEEGKLWLHLETTWRSRDAWAAAFPNMWALTDLQRLIAQRLSEKLDEEVSVGTYVDFSSSYHIYGKTIKRTGGSFTGFLEQVKLRPPEKRFLNSDDPTVQEIFEETRAKFTR